MPSAETLLVFTLAALVMNASPGPSNLYVMSRSVAQGKAAGVVATFGLAMGSLVHVAAAALGVSAIFQYSPGAYTAMKLLGAAYLIYLGLRYLTDRQTVNLMPSSGPPIAHAGVFVQSALVEILNPKTALFFLAFLPQFVDVSLGRPALQMGVLGIIVTATAIPCDLLVAWSSRVVAQRWLDARALRQLQRWGSGSMLLAVGIYVALRDRA